MVVDGLDVDVGGLDVLGVLDVVGGLDVVGEPEVALAPPGAAAVLEVVVGDGLGDLGEGTVELEVVVDVVDVTGDGADDGVLGVVAAP